MQKLFTFSAESFGLSPEVEALLRSKNAIFMDFGSSAYVRSEGVPAIIGELISINQRSQSISAQQVDAEKGAIQVQQEKLNGEIQSLFVKLETKEREVVSLEKLLEDSGKTVESLRAENLRLTSLSRNQEQKPLTNDGNKTIQESYEKLQLAFQKLRAENIDAITSLKVLEDENDDLRKELESIRTQARATCRA